MEKKDTLSSCSESEEQQMQLIQDKSKESCMVSFQRLHSHLKRLSNNDLKGSRTENGFGHEPLAVPLEGLHVDDKLHFVEEPVEIIDREVKRLKKIRILIVKVQWNSKRGPEFTWEREDQFQKKYLHLFTKLVPSSSVAT
ncbi:hypothetical protein Tco_0822048 [Tanacetum coccineum]|uniref:Reverse transcriptase domain-containing protein n=1 Tax=Tanacetum coccineum TaxID=301880 RepID=A0ABQ5AIT5_9ASTR